MELKEMTIEELEARKAAIAEEVDNPEADLTALEEEVRAIKEELESRKAAETKKAEIRASVASGQGKVIKKMDPEERKVKTVEEIRESKEYIDAFANYIKTNDDSECRALLSTNAPQNGQVPVPTYIEGRIRTAWERNGLMNLVRKTYLRGNVQIGFELSATGAQVHIEGTTGEQGVPEETLTFGVVIMIPQSIKKWIRISDEAMDMGGQEFLDYIYDEITYQIAKEAQRLLINLIDDAPATSGPQAVGVPVITGASSDLMIARKAAANLSQDARNITVVINRLSEVDLIAAMAANGYRFEPFEGMTVEYDSNLPAYSAAASGDTWMIVGDFGIGAQANFPNGDQIRIKYDDLTEAQDDLVKLVGREYVALGLVTPNAFVKVQKGTEEGTEEG